MNKLTKEFQSGEVLKAQDLNTIKDKVNELVEDANSGSGATIDIDSSLSTTSTNPVQNKVITEELDKKVAKVDGKGLSTNDFDNLYKSKVDNMSESSLTHIGSIEEATDEHLINIDPSGEYIETVLKSEYDLTKQDIYNKIAELQLQSPNKIAVYYQSGSLSPESNGNFGLVDIADCWRPYLIDCTKNRLEDSRIVGELKRNNFFRFVDGSFAPTVGITSVQKAECDVELYLDESGTQQYCDANNFDALAFFNEFGMDQKLYNSTGNEVRILRPWETTETNYSIMIGLPCEMYFIDNEIGNSGKRWKGVFSSPITWDGIVAKKLERTGLSPGPSTTFGGKFRNYFFLYNTGDPNTMSCKGRDELFTAFYRADRTYPRTNDVNQMSSASFARANNYDSTKPYPFSEIGMFAYCCFLTSHEIKHNTKALHSPSLFSSGISSNDRIANYEQLLQYGGVRYSTDGGNTFVYAIWNETKGLCLSGGNSSFMSEFLNVQWAKEQCMEAQMALSFAAELGIQPNTDFTFYGETYYYQNPDGVVSLLQGEMNARLYKKVSQTINCFNSAGESIVAKVECIIRVPIMDGFNICGDISRYIPGGCEIVGKRLNEAPGGELPYSIYLETDQKKFLSESVVYKGINETFEFERKYKKIGEYTGFNGFRKSLAPYTFVGGDAGGTILTGECAKLEGHDTWSSSTNQIGRMASKQGSHARLSEIGPRFAYITNAASYAVRNVGSSMQVLL
ncbi:hypothetical protein [Candidatus Bacteroides intestinigallinarum]|uniref:hypothetical protein n=1 Tax=Candidatus Bacteroides intestinigallinarum TaxID=2838470 RepID=UPI0022DF9B66|nr:hypothetical protein [Candidatus Bacteroides intestinigallinarum]